MKDKDEEDDAQNQLEVFIRFVDCCCPWPNIMIHKTVYVIGEGRDHDNSENEIIPQFRSASFIVSVFNLNSVEPLEEGFFFLGIIV